MAWPTGLDATVAAAAVLPIQSMGVVDLWRYSAHLAEQEQASQTYRIQFWKLVLRPFACLVMVALALPFAYLHARSGGISVKVFGGVMLGISFVLLNNVVGHLGLLHDWTPWIAASVPSVVYLLLSMSAFAWLVRYR
jgi:lipopolysaccharide export system permease protein